MRFYSDRHINVLLTPSNTPQFSPIVIINHNLNYNVLGEYVFIVKKENKKFNNQKQRANDLGNYRHSLFL